MERYELVERLRQRAHVSYEDAKAALEESDWDLLDALVRLEQAGKVDKAAAEGYTDGERAGQEARRGGTGFWESLGEGINRCARRIISVDLHVRRDGMTVFQLPLFIFLILLLISRGSLLTVMLVSLIFGISYRFDSAKTAQAAGHEARAENRQ